MLLLIVASFWSWVLIIDKSIAFGSLKRKASAFREEFLVRPLARRPLRAALACAPISPSRRCSSPRCANGSARSKAARRDESQLASVKERVEKAMSVSIQREVEKIERGLGYLATVGSTAPFVGLFGTVWGIMTAFQAIAARQDTTLAVVAPGIADALFATALGLVAAIPAVVAYNRFVNEVGRYTGRLEAFADEFSTFLSRQLDERAR